MISYNPLRHSITQDPTTYDGRPSVYHPLDLATWPFSVKCIVQLSTTRGKVESTCMVHPQCRWPLCLFAKKGGMLSCREVPMT